MGEGSPAQAKSPTKDRSANPDESIGPASTIVSWGELLWDLFPDESQLGGCAANVAYHAHQLGNRAILVTRVGDDELGRDAIKVLAQAGLDTNFVQVDATEPTGSVRVRIADGEPTFSIAAQAAWDRIEVHPDTLETAGATDVLCYGTLAQRTPLNSDALDRLMGSLAPNSDRLCDLNVRQPFATKETVAHALRQATSVKLNENEANVLGKMFDVDDPTRWMLSEFGIRLVALTRGRNGSILTTSDAEVAHPGVPATPGGDAVGAGDAFAAVLAHHLAKGSSLETMSLAANRYASYVASRSGAMPIIPESIRRAGLGVS